ncbi:hypothetical protein [Pseudorhodoplanes sp.]|uniref:hypothetical protein n=1 Tax=Pseudorhodoplanes sp. TaxID=1934341 RepID=UPI003D13C88B
MTEKRSVSQIQFGHLPQQTVDIRGGIWLVQEWMGSILRQNIDERALKRELCRLASPWAATNRDGGFVLDLERRNAPVVVRSLNRDRGVRLKPFPEIWNCRTCFRIHDNPDGRCKCGSSSRKGQLQFVAYSESTGELREPSIPRCPTHDESRINLPGTATGSEVTFDCPTCSRVLRGFGYMRSSAGDRMSINVHRAASVFTPRNVVVVNPPSLERMRALQDAGGGTRALEWLLDSMPGRSMLEVKPTKETLRRQLAASGLDEGTIERMLSVAAEADGGSREDLRLTPEVRTVAEEQAMTVALALSESRVTISDLERGLDAMSPLGHRYGVRYPLALRSAGLERVELVDKFPILTGHFGYTRGPSEPGAAHLVTYRDRRGTYEIYGEIAETEALYIGLEPLKVAEWLELQGFHLGDYADAKGARSSILSAMTAADANVDEAFRALLTLIHSYAHRLIRFTAVHAGIELHALSELLVPSHLGFFVYAATRGDFVLGGLQALFENDLDRLLHDFTEGEHRCALDPGCAKAGGACVACLHLGEPSCRLFNGFLDRGCLSGARGYLSVCVEGANGAR